MTLTLVTLTIIGSLTLTSLLDFLVAMQGWILQCRASTLYCLELLLVFTGFNGHCHTCPLATPLFCPSLRFPSGVGWVLNLPCPSPPACDNLLCPLTPPPSLPVPRVQWVHTGGL